MTIAQYAPDGTLQIPYHNLILTGFIGINRMQIGRMIANHIGVPFVDVQAEVEVREGATTDEIRQLFGEQRLRTLENEVCRELALRRSSVLSISGVTLLDIENRQRLLNGGMILVLKCTLNEVLRRLHASQGARFHDPKVRSAALNQIRREQQVLQLTDLPMLDTTTLSTEDTAARAIDFWYEQETITV
jgi:shikimate kinase